MKILCVGYYGKDNIGDESYKVAFPALWPFHEWKFAETPTVSLVDWSDAIVLGGGNVLTPKFCRALEAYRSSKPIYAVSVGCLDADLDPYDLQMFEAVYVRDAWSWERLRKVGRHSEIIPDVVFGLTPDRGNGLALLGRIRDEIHWKLPINVGVTVNAHLTGFSVDGSPRYALARDAFRFQQFSLELASVLDGVAGNAVFLPYMTKKPYDDRAPNAWVASRMELYTKAHVVYGPLGVQDMLDLTSVLDLSITTRFHQAVFSAIAGVPFVDVSHHDKNKNFVESLGNLGRGVSYWDFQRNAFEGMIRDALEGYSKEELMLSAASLKTRLLEFAHAVRFDR